ncbi:MAG: peptidoglycan D,D-transpeptidase FtsI family protein [Chitinophagales bacterium]
MLCLFASTIVFKLFYIQFVEGATWMEKSRVTTRIDTIEGERGNIYSSDSKLLATSLPSFEVRWDARRATDSLFQETVDSLAWYMSSYFKDATYEAYKEIFLEERKKDNGYALIKRKVNYNQLKVIKRFPLFRERRLKGGLIVHQTNSRVTPFQLLAKRTVGYVRANSQPVGLEGSFDHYLRGETIPRSEYKSGAGDWVPVNDTEVLATGGKDIYTAIDVNLQDIVETALSKGVTRHDASHGCAVLMEVATGEIKAIANLGIGTDSTYWEKYNYAIGEKKEPGSTFKVAALLALLEDKLATDTTKVWIEGGTKQYHDKVMRDASWSPYDTLTLSQIIQLSSNVGISKLVDSLYSNQPNRFLERLEKMHLTQKTEIEITGEPNPTIPYPGEENWSGVTLPWMAIGYGLEVTPLQTLTFINAIANEGKMMKPYLVKEVRDMGVSVKKYQPKVLEKKICSKKTAEQIKKILIGVVEKGTAKNIKSDKLLLAGKTGTNRLARNDKGYAKRYQASFMGFFPANKPQYSCIVVINKPNAGQYYGGTVAAPIFKEIAEKVYGSDVDIKDGKPVNIEDKERALFAQKVPLSKHGKATDLEQIYKTIGIKPMNEDKNDWVVTKTRHNQYNR